MKEYVQGWLFAEAKRPKRYGLPYKGSKNRFAERITALLPPGGTLYDVFAGGCAITHCALLTGKWERVCANDIKGFTALFKDAAEGKCTDLKRWISHDDFFRLRDTDPLVRLIWGFGNDGHSYLYSRDLEPYKKALHEMLNAESIEERRLCYHNVIREMAGLMKKRNQSWRSLRAIEHLERAQHIERLESLRRLAGTGLQGLEVTTGDYRDVEIKPPGVIYCDPPYKGTGGYRIRFDHEAFYEWALRQELPVYISEYEMPDEFECVAEWKTVTRIGADTCKEVTERVFTPRRKRK